MNREMATPILPRDRLKWTRDFVPRPIWPSEPDVRAIKSLGLRTLPFEYLQGQDASLLQVRFFSQGRFNKTYELYFPCEEKKYLLRVTLPMDPFFKTESEVATIEFVRQKTTIPVTRVVAWNSFSNNVLGYEWLLMEKLDGIPVGTVWETMPWESKAKISQKLGEYASQLRKLPFDKIGSVYFEDARLDEMPNVDDINDKRRRGKHHPISLNGAESGFEYFTIVDPPTAKFAIGKILSTLFFRKNGLHMQGNRGPFLNSNEYMAEGIKFQLHWIDTSLDIAQSEDPNNADSDCDEEFVKNAPEMRSLCDDALALLQNIFPPHGDHELPPFLHHHDLKPENILINPTDYTITGIIDWEMICVLPRWEATEYPKLFPDSLLVYHDKEDHDIIKRYTRDSRNLRRIFDETIDAAAANTESSSVTPHAEEFNSYKKKKCFQGMVVALANHWQFAFHLIKLFDKTIPEKAGFDSDKEQSAIPGDEVEGGRDLTPNI